MRTASCLPLLAILLEVVSDGHERDDDLLQCGKYLREMAALKRFASTTSAMSNLESGLKMTKIRRPSLCYIMTYPSTTAMRA